MAQHQQFVQQEGGVSFTVFTDDADADDPVAADLRRGLFPAHATLALLQRFAPPGSRVLDLGAHLGSFTLAAAAAGYEVLAVEASPANAKLLEMSIAANGFGNRVHLANAAVSDKPGELRFHSQGPYGHVATNEWMPATVVQAVTVDGVLERMGWGTAAFVKLDVEGSEVACLRGMAGLLARPDAPILFCESNGHMLEYFGQTPASLKREVASLGLAMFLVEEGGLRPVDADDLQGEAVVDYLVVRDRSALAGQTFLASLGIDEQVERLLASTLSPYHTVRMYALRTIQAGGHELLRRAAVRAAVEQLREDSFEPARSLARSIELRPARRPWWRVFG